MKISSGRCFKPSTFGTMCILGIRINPATIENNAAPTDEKYASISISPSILLALDFILVIAGAINPKMISGTVNDINCPRINLIY